MNQMKMISWKGKYSSCNDLLGSLCITALSVLYAMYVFTNDPDPEWSWVNPGLSIDSPNDPGVGAEIIIKVKQNMIGW